MRFELKASVTFRLVCNPKHNLSTRVVRLGLSLRCDRFTQRQNLCHDWLNLARVGDSRHNYRARAPGVERCLLTLAIVCNQPMRSAGLEPP